MKEKPVAICCSDIHLSQKPPIARSAEPDWFEAQKRPLQELHAISEEYQVPIIIAGDIFHKWNPPPELINFALEYMPPDSFCIPGQHDLPLHNIEDIKKSAYWTLLHTGIIHDVEEFPHSRGLCLHAFPWGKELEPLEETKITSKAFNVAIVHKYLWMHGASYPNAPQDSRVKNVLKQLKGYDAVVIGDNHIPWECKHLFNCGSLMRRNIDQINHKPRVGLLHSSGRIESIELDCSEDKFIDPDYATAIIEKAVDMSDFIAELGGLGKTTVDFIEAVKIFIDKYKLSKRTKKIINEVLEKAQEE